MKNEILWFEMVLVDNFVLPSIVKIGGENLMQTLTDLEKRQILNSKYQSLEKMVELVHCGTRDDFKNIVITNLKDKFAYKYDSQKGFFVSYSNSRQMIGRLMKKFSSVSD
jgi:hypothetical protein